MAMQVVTLGNLGHEFDLGNIEADKIHLKVDGATLVRQLDGTVVVNPAALATTNALVAVAPDLVSTVNGVQATVDMTPIVKALETLTTLSYDPVTRILRYTGENGTPVGIDLSGLATDIHLSGGTYNAAAGTLTLVDNDGGTPDVVLDLSDLKKVVTGTADGVAIAGDGTTANPLTLRLVVDPASDNLLTLTAAGLAVPSTAIAALATVEVQDAFGVPLFHALP